MVCGLQVVPTPRLPEIDRLFHPITSGYRETILRSEKHPTLQVDTQVELVRPYPRHALGLKPAMCLEQGVPRILLCLSKTE